MNQFTQQKNWSVFLDRDGVLNQRLINDYVKTPEEFIWNKGALECLSFLAKNFGEIVVITNQQGIGKGLMSYEQLEEIHRKMKSDAKQAGGRIDKVYFCPDLEESNSFFRKPAIGLALKAKKDFPSINFRKSLMIGDTFTDMLFGKRMKMKTILVSADSDLPRNYPRLIDLWFEDMEKLLYFLRNSFYL